MSGARNVADRAISGSLDRTGWNDKGDFLESSATLAGWNAVLIKPQTFMNRSGEPLRSYLSFKKIPITKVIVVHDEIDLPVGSLRVKVGGGEGGHNGLRSISTCCGGKDYARVRAGVGKPAPGSPLALAPDGVATWVLSRFANDEATVVHHLVGQAAAAVVSLATQGLEKAQRTYNR
jgi:PTH1 family peptidyl-tRNA hydrolase